MLKNLTYKKRVIILIIGLIVLLFIVQRFAIRRTLNLKSQCKTMISKLDEAKDAPVAIINIKNRLNIIEGIVGENILNGDDVQEFILEETSNYCLRNKLILKSLPRPHEYSSNNYTVETCILEVEGGFKGLLKLVYLFEQKLTLGKIASVSFIKEEDRFTKINRLKVKIYIQNIKPINNEKDI